MLKRITFSVICLFVPFGFLVGAAHGQGEQAGEDEVVDSIRRLTTISPNDQQRIADWVRAKVDALGAMPEQDRPGAFKRYRDVFRDQYRNSENSEPFQLQLAVQTASVASSEFAKPDLDPTVAHVLARALVDMERVETAAGLIAGLESTSAVVRLLCANGLAARRDAIAADPQLLGNAVQALRKAGAVETQPVVLGRIYGALAYANEVPAVFDAYIDLFDKRLERRRGSAVIADGAEDYAFEFFRTGGVLAALNAGQKAELARRLAVFFRLDAQRYNQADLAPPKEESTIDAGFDERDKIERLLVSNEETLLALVTRGEKAIAEELKSGGYAQRAEILQHVYKWVGHPETKERGILNEAPWNVDVGAP